MERIVLGHKLEIDPIANHFHIIVSLGRARNFPIIQNNEKKSYTQSRLCFALLICRGMVPDDVYDSSRRIQGTVQRQGDGTVVGVGGRIPGGSSLLQK